LTFFPETIDKKESLPPKEESLLPIYLERRSGESWVKRNSPRGQTSRGVGKQSQKQRGFYTTKVSISPENSHTSPRFPLLGYFRLLWESYRPRVEEFTTPKE